MNIWFQLGIWAFVALSIFQLIRVIHDWKDNRWPKRFIEIAILLLMVVSTLAFRFSFLNQAATLHGLLQSTSRRVITTQQRQTVVGLLRSAHFKVVKIWYADSDSEAADYAYQIRDLLQASGIRMN